MRVGLRVRGSEGGKEEGGKEEGGREGERDGGWEREGGREGGREGERERISTKEGRRVGRQRAQSQESQDHHQPHLLSSATACYRGSPRYWQEGSCDKTFCPS